MLTVVHVIGSKNNSRAGTKWQVAVFEICEGRPRGTISPCALERHVLYLATSAAVHGGRCGGRRRGNIDGPPQSLADRSACLSRRGSACMHGAMACLGADRDQVLARRAPRRIGRDVFPPPGPGIFQGPGTPGHCGRGDERARTDHPRRVRRLRDGTRGYQHPYQVSGSASVAAPESGVHGLQQATLRDRRSKVTIETLGIPVRAPMLAAGQIDAALGYSFRLYVDLKDRGVPADDIVLMPMADYGLKLYGNAIITNPKFAAENPDAIRAFLHAFLQGLKEIVRRPAEAVESVVRRDDTVKRDIELERLRMAIRDNIVTPEVRADGYGAVDFLRLTESIDQIGLVYPFKAKPSAEDIFEPSFLPPIAERRVH